MKQLSPQQKLQLFLLENDYPYRDIPYILKYCPQLLQHFTVEEIGMAALTDISLFEPQKTTLRIRPIVVEAMKAEVGKTALHTNIEHSMSIFCQDTIEQTMRELIQTRKDSFK